MRRLIFVVIASAALLLASCNACVHGEGDNTREIRLTSSFENLELNCSAEVIFYKKNTDEPTKIVVETQPNIIPLLTSEVKGQTLKIDTEGCVNTNNPILISVYADDIISITNNGSGSIRTNNKINVSRFVLHLHGSGSIDAEVQANEVEIDQNGSGSMHVYGNANEVHINNDSSGSCDAVALIANEAEVNLTGSGSVSVFATKEMDLRLRGSGSISYSGQPEKLNTQKDGSGEIHEAQ